MEPIAFDDQQKNLIAVIARLKKEVFQLFGVPKHLLMKKELKDLVNDDVAIQGIVDALNKVSGKNVETIAGMREHLKQRNAVSDVNELLHVAKVLQSYGYGPE